MNVLTPLPHAAAPESAARPHAVVIGAGFGGLAAAVRLGARGYRVTVVEKLDQAGGRARVFREGGFTFDAFMLSREEAEEVGQPALLATDRGRASF